MLDPKVLPESPIQGRSLTAVLTSPPNGGYVAILKDPIEFAIRKFGTTCKFPRRKVSRPRLIFMARLANFHVGRYLDLD